MYIHAFLPCLVLTTLVAFVLVGCSSSTAFREISEAQPAANCGFGVSAHSLVPIHGRMRMPMVLGMRPKLRLPA